MIGDQGLYRELGIGLSLGNCDGGRRPETVTGRLHPCGSAPGGRRQRKDYEASAGGAGRSAGSSRVEGGAC